MIIIIIIIDKLTWLMSRASVMLLRLYHVLRTGPLRGRCSVPWGGHCQNSLINCLEMYMYKVVSETIRSLRFLRLTFFKIQKMTIRFLSCCSRFLEHWNKFNWIPLIRFSVEWLGHARCHFDVYFVWVLTLWWRWRVLLWRRWRPID